MSTGSKSSDALDEGTCAVMEASMLEEEGYFDPAASSGAGVTEAGQRRRRLDSLCRVCANASDYFIPIFEGEGAEHQLDMKIQKHLPIQVIEADCLPAQVCYQCASTLIAWHDLVTACVEADKKLHQLLQDNENDIGNHEEKVVEFFNEPPVDSEGDDFNEPSTSTAVVEVRECLPAQKRRISGKGKQHRKANVDNVLSESDVKSSTALSNSTEACADQKEYVESASSTERWHLTRYAPFHLPKYEAGSDGFCNIPQWIKTEDGIDLTEIKSFEPVFQVPDRPIFECDHCGKILSTRENMKIHLRIHTGERPFTCHICGKSFQAPSGFKRHLKEVHEGIKDKLCDICNRAFANRRTLEDHRRIHTGERPFVCALCGKMFKTKASLYIHNRSHSNVFPFPCSRCDNRFRTQATLSLHVLRHTGEKPHVCELCGRGFRVKYELGRHMLIHSDNKPFSCEKCGHTFRQKKYLANHNRTHHKDSDDDAVVCSQKLNI